MSILNNPATQLRPERTDAETEWCRSYANVLELADYLVHENELTSAHLVLKYFEKPWKWTSEWRAYQKQTNVMEDTDDLRSDSPTQRLPIVVGGHQSV